VLHFKADFKSGWLQIILFLASSRTRHENLSLDGSSGLSAEAEYEISAVQLPELTGDSQVPL
jgi:hypothetical protein